jgi:hypothetical protein
VYEIVRTIYTSTADGNDASRVAVLQQTLSQLRLTNIATLDACMNHFTRLIDLTSADEEYVSALATSLAPCILRPRTETSLTMEEKHAYKLVRDLFAHKDAVFNELKRMSSVNHSSAASSNRPRAISTDESNRKALMEERNRALLEKANATRGRATSPAPSPRGHRRDRSAAGAETRFPIQTSPTSAADRQRSSLGGVKRSSLEVPGNDGTASVEAPNGVDTIKTTEIDAVADKRDSTGSRAGAKFVGGRRVPQSPPRESNLRGVTLEDKAMDD